MMGTKTLDHDPDESVGRPDEEGVYWLKRITDGSWEIVEVDKSPHRDSYYVRFPNGLHKELSMSQFDNAKFVGPLEPPAA